MSEELPDKTVSLPIEYASISEWEKMGERLFFTKNKMDWLFECPSCGFIASGHDWKAVGAPEEQVAFSCVGRHIPRSKNIFEKPGPCNYAGGGLFGLNPVKVTLDAGKTISIFQFAPIQPQP